MTRPIELKINGETFHVEVEPHETLLDVIRGRVGLTGTKKGCETGQCGACTIIVEGKAVNACLILAVEAHGREIVTVEGLAKDRQLHPLQQAFVEEGAVQCGYCTPGMLLSAKALLDENPRPTQRQVKEAIAGNLCRCTGYVKIVKAIMTAAEKISVGQKIKDVALGLARKPGM